MRMLAGPPADTRRASPWHDIAHGWTKKIQMLFDHAGLTPWSVTSMEARWTFVSYVATLPSEKWTRRMLVWNTGALRTRGRPANTWETAQKIILDNWIVEGAAKDHWMLMKLDFVLFILHDKCPTNLNLLVFFVLLAPCRACFMASKL